MDGFVVIDKPKGPTSHQIDHWVRTITGESKVGHIGTLDPGASGVLVMALGKAVKLIDIVHEYPKSYVFVIGFHGDIGEQRIHELTEEFTGEIYQLPPVRSAVLRAVRVRKIYAIDVLEISGRDVLMSVKCDSGTYVRTLCTDMGLLAGTGAQMKELRRISTGPFNEERMITLQQLSDDFISHVPERSLIPMDFIFRDMPKIVVKNSALRNISHGSDLFPGGIKAVLGSPRKGERVCVVSEENDIVGTGKMLVSVEDIHDLKVVDFDRIFLEPVMYDGKGDVVRSGEGREKVQVQKTHGGSFRSTEGSKEWKNTGSRKHSGRRHSRPERNNTEIRKGKNKGRIHR